MEFKDYYKILGVAADAETADIKVAYRKLARKYHPDLNPGEAAEDNFKEVAEAWEVLKNAERRAEYDELRRYGGQRQEFKPPPGWQSSAADAQASEADFSEFFNSIFGSRFSGAGRAGANDFGVRGQDIEIEMPVFLEETLTATSKPLQYELPVIEGGQLRRQRKSLKVTIPAGVTDGERIRLRGQGSPGTGDSPPGDLYLHIRLVPHPVFDVEGRNLLLTVPVTPGKLHLAPRLRCPPWRARFVSPLPRVVSPDSDFACAARDWWARPAKATSLPFSKSSCHPTRVRKFSSYGSSWRKRQLSTREPIGRTHREHVSQHNHRRGTLRVRRYLALTAPAVGSV
jgi:curved DNA-binding protein